MTEQKQYQCRHIFTDGHRCGSRCLRGEALCYYHHTTRKPAARTRRSRTSTFELPLPEDHSAIQHSIGQVLQRIASNQIDPRRAGLLLYGLQIASLNLPKPKSETKQETVEELTTHPKLGTLAPPSELNASKPKSAVQKLIEDLMNEPEIEPRHKQPTPHPEHTILPNLNASVEEPPIRMPDVRTLGHGSHRASDPPSTTQLQCENSQVRILPALALLALATTGCHSTPPPMPLSELNPQQTHGHTVFQSQCARCHNDRKDAPLNGPAMIGVFKKPYLHSGAPANDERVTATILRGRNLMPAMGNNIDQQDLDDLLAYLHTL